MGETLSEEIDVIGLESSLPQEARQIAGDLKLDGKYDVSGALERFIASVISSLKDNISDLIAQTAGLIAVIILSAGLNAAELDTRQKRIFIITSSVVCILISSNGLDSAGEIADKAMDNIVMYSNSALPTIYLASTACGCVVSAPVKYAASCLAIDVVISSAEKLCVPIIKCFFALSVSAAIFDNAMIKGLAKTAKWLSVTVMTGLLLIFTAYISFSGVISGSADAVAVKAAKTTISTALPVVGGIISDAAATVLAAASLIKNSAGVFALVAVGAICVEPFAHSLVRMLMFKLCSVIADGAGCAEMGRVLADISTYISLYCGLIGSSALILFISIASAVMTVSV